MYKTFSLGRWKFSVQGIRLIDTQIPDVWIVSAKVSYQRKHHTQYVRAVNRLRDRYGVR